MADFIDAVQYSRWLIDRALGKYEDDDFVNLETQQAVAEPTALASAQNDNILHALVNDESSYTATKPFLSKSAEVELYLLATNFLVSFVMFRSLRFESFCFFRTPTENHYCCNQFFSFCVENRCNYSSMLPW